MNMKRALARKALERATAIFLDQLAEGGEVVHGFEIKGGLLTVGLTDLGDGDEEILLELSWSFGAHRGAVSIPIPIGDVGGLD